MPTYLTKPHSQEAIRKDTPVLGSCPGTTHSLNARKDIWVTSVQFLGIVICDIIHGQNSQRLIAPKKCKY